MKFYRKELFTIPNILTYIRILCVPFFVWLMLDSSIVHHIMIALGLFMFASLTDLIDGFIARHYNLISDIGKIADPIADKLLQVSTLICLTLNDYIPLAITIIFFCKEIYLVLGGSVIVKIFKSQYSLQSNIFGKCATMLNTFGLFLAFFIDYANSAYKLAVAVILYIGAAFGIITALIYSVEFVIFRKNELAEKKKSIQVEDENIEADDATQNILVYDDDADVKNKEIISEQCVAKEQVTEIQSHVDNKII